MLQCFGLGLLFLQYKELAGVFIAAFILVVFPLSEALLPVSNAVEKIPQFEELLKRGRQWKRTGGDVNEKKKHTLSLPYKGSWNSVRLKIEHEAFAIVMRRSQ